ncbi:hypothetical protein EVAR_86293_1 [Eumeta japonica]|uniref:Uncharacterized protein n=1 Tax=Eumeta variegata TaxID=151549 RepID=A0A4C1UD96_EUMVA|nr:hypothetical protein EVAR_86293_1 [Eumeta japonica]
MDINNPTGMTVRCRPFQECTLFLKTLLWQSTGNTADGKSFQSSTVRGRKSRIKRTVAQRQPSIFVDDVYRIGTMDVGVSQGVVFVNSEIPRASPVYCFLLSTPGACVDLFSVEKLMHL